MTSTMDCAGTTRIGQVRKQNEDNFLIARLAKTLSIVDSSVEFAKRQPFRADMQGTLCVVADGMGGHAAGERASRLAVESIAEYVLNFLPWFYSLHSNSNDELIEDLKTGLTNVQDRLFEHTAWVPADAGMGTTLTMAYLLERDAYIVHAGDSRCYLSRGVRLKQLTQDQTVAQAYLDRGFITAEEMDDSPFQHVLWNVVAGDSTKLVSTAFRVRLQPADTLLLCSDGLIRHVNDEEIREVLQSPQPAADVCKQLADLAEERGGTDNITIVIARLPEGEESKESSAEVAVSSLADTAVEIPVVRDKKRVG